MRVLVTGATGGLGRNLCLHLRAHGYDIRGTGRNVAIGQELQAEGIDFHSCDLAKTEPLDLLVGDCDAVVHCAALSSVWGRLDAFVQANEIATKNLLAASLRRGVRRFVYVSTTSVYFDNKDRYNIAETDAVAQPLVNAYALTKYRAEGLVKEAQVKGLETIIIRPRGIFGPYDQNLFPRIMRAAGKGVLPLPNNGRAVVDITYVENVAEALRLTLEARQEAVGKIFNITNGEPWAVRDIFETLFKLMDKQVRLLPVSRIPLKMLAGAMEQMGTMLGMGEPPLTRYAVGLLARSQTLNINAARRELGYMPQIGVAEGLRRFAAWCKENA